MDVTKRIKRPPWSRRRRRRERTSRTDVPSCASQLRELHPLERFKPPLSSNYTVAYLANKHAIMSSLMSVSRDRHTMTYDETISLALFDETPTAFAYGMRHHRHTFLPSGRGKPTSNDTPPSTTDHPSLFPTASGGQLGPFWREKIQDTDF